MVMHEFLVVGRARPETNPKWTQIFKMRIFAEDEIKAKSRFWYFMGKLRKVKKANGEVLAVHEIMESKPRLIKNFAIWVRYDSRSGTHNICKEYRDTTLTGAVQQMYLDLAARHRARKSCIQILKTAVVPASKCQREIVKQMHDSAIRFPLVDRFNRLRHPDRVNRSTFVARRPTTAM